MSHKDSKEDIRRKVSEDEDFIYYPRLGNSLKNLMNKHPNGIDNELIQKVLLLSKDEITSYYSSALKKLKKLMGDNNI